MESGWKVDNGKLVGWLGGWSNKFQQTEVSESFKWAKGSVLLKCPVRNDFERYRNLIGTLKLRKSSKQINAGQQKQKLCVVSVVQHIFAVD